MYDVILFAAIATVVCAMLYSVLGKSVGNQTPNPEIENFLKNEPDLKPAMIDPVEEFGDFPDIGKIRGYDSSFSVKSFVDQAQGAYGMILESFADGDREMLGELLAPNVYEVYEASIQKRELDNLTQITDLARLIKAEIVSVNCDGPKARIGVEFDAELTSALKDAEGNVVQGDLNLISRSQEVWSFERDMKSKSLNWLLADVAPSTGNAPEADPTPDTL